MRLGGPVFVESDDPEVLAGQGGFDIRSYVSGVAGLAHQPPLMLEHLESPAEYDRARQYVLSVARDIGLSFDV